MDKLMEICTICLEEKAHEEFQRSADRANGILRQCKSCLRELKNKSNHAYRLEHRESGVDSDEIDTTCDGEWLGSGNWIY